MFSMVSGFKKVLCRWAVTGSLFRTRHKYVPVGSRAASMPPEGSEQVSRYCPVRLRSFFLVIALFGYSLTASAAGDIVDAVREKNVSVAETMLADGVDVNARSSDGTTALHWAVYNGNHELAEQLIEAGADVNVRNDYASSPMSEAGVTGDYEMLKLLLDAGADVESPTREGQTVLMSVVMTPHVKSAKLLIRHGVDVNAFETWRGQTALMFASAQSQPEMVELLIDHGAEVDTRSTIEEWERMVTAEPRPQGRPLGGFTALLLAAREGCAACAEELVDGGADINLVDPYGITPLLMATLNARWDVAKVLIEAGADVNRWDMWGRAPLYSTVDYSTVPRGGRPDRPSLDKTTPVEVAAMLLEAGANPNMQLKLFPPYRSLGNDRGGDSMLTIGTTPLIRAAKGHDIPMVELLLEYGALPNLQNWPGYTPLATAAGLGTTTLDLRAKFRNEAPSMEVAGMLLAAGADMHETDDQGRTALHGAVMSGWFDFTRWLVEQGADIDAADNNGFTPLDYAMGRANRGGRFGSLTEPNEELAGLLLELGATPVSTTVE